MNNQQKTGIIKLHSWRDFTKVMKVMGAGKWIYRGHEDAWQFLDQANINASTIYPDLVGIAKSVRYNEGMLGL